MPLACSKRSDSKAREESSQREEKLSPRSPRPPLRFPGVQFIQFTRSSPSERRALTICTSRTVYNAAEVRFISIELNLSVSLFTRTLVLP